MNGETIRAYSLSILFGSLTTASFLCLCLGALSTGCAAVQSEHEPSPRAAIGANGPPERVSHTRGRQTLACTDSPAPERRTSLAFRTMSFDDIRLHCAEQSTATSEDDLASWSLLSGGQWYGIEKKGWDFEKRISSVEIAGQRAVELRVNATAGSTAHGGRMDKLMVRLFGRFATRAAEPEFGRPLFYRFDVLLPDDFESPEDDSVLIIWQLWQGSPFGPPVAVSIGPSRQLRLLIRNDETTAMPGAEPILLYESEPLTRAIWHRVVLEINPIHASSPLLQGSDGRCRCEPTGGAPGSVALWLDAEQSPRIREHLFVGYDPGCFANYHGAFPRTDPACTNPGPAYRRRASTGEPSAGTHPNPVLSPSFGIYRHRQAREHVLFFDNVRVAPSWNDATLARVAGTPRQEEVLGGIEHLLAGLEAE